ncbi:hypothetical protein [Phytopseudomonas dryadis]|uniref:Uncharacterized protein n=1 Tax=Phytopseudomonas dryadis TaxID=2487520 RepID=A0A4Q9R997_9GAMM|nr:hypothetical protein [Pseudomonas dryadis]TBU96737.1 hypothetical protein DNK44_03715 [Pseudomonas dryadis]
MLKGLAITPPVLGRISIGKVVEKNGKRLPEKDDQFTITSQVGMAYYYLIKAEMDKLYAEQKKELKKQLHNLDRSIPRPAKAKA